MPSPRGPERAGSRARERPGPGDRVALGVIDADHPEPFQDRLGLCRLRDGLDPQHPPDLLHGLHDGAIEGVLDEVLDEAAIDLPANYMDDTKEEYLRRRNVLVKRLNAMPGVFCPNPGGAFYAIARLPIDDADKFCQWLLESFNHHQQTVMVAPATGFYGTKGLGTHEVRFAYVLNTNDLNRAMDCLEKALQVYPGRTIPQPVMVEASLKG